MTTRRLAIVAVAYVGLGSMGMAGWWLATRPSGRGDTTVSAATPTLIYPNSPPPTNLVGDARATWRSAYLDGWKWRIGQCLEGRPGSRPTLFIAGDRPRADGFAAGWGAAHLQVEELVRHLGIEPAAAVARTKARAQPGLFDPGHASPPPPE